MIDDILNAIGVSGCVAAALRLCYQRGTTEGHRTVGCYVRREMIETPTSFVTAHGTHTFDFEEWRLSYVETTNSVLHELAVTCAGSSNSTCNSRLAVYDRIFGSMESQGVCA